jgi:hypothetical protein
MVKLDMTVNLKPDDIKEAIRLYLQEELNVDTTYDDITFDVQRQYEDRPMGGEGLPILKGANIKVQRRTEYER